MINVRKAAIIGCGFVGSSIAFSLMQRGLYSELVLIDANQAKAEGEAMDLSHGLPYAASMQIYAGTYDDVADCETAVNAYNNLMDWGMQVLVGPCLLYTSRCV